MSLPKPASARGRPPRVPRATLGTRDLLLQCGLEVLTEQGFAATGIDTILKKASVPKGSFYHYFESKEDFGLAIIRRYADYFAHKLDRCFLDESEPPIRRLRNFVAEAKAGIQKYNYARGCLIGNLGQEIVLLPTSFRSELEGALQDWQHRLTQCLHLAADAGELVEGTDCADAAFFFWTGWEGAVLRARLTQSAAPLDRFLTSFLVGIVK